MNLIDYSHHYLLNKIYDMVYMIYNIKENHYKIEKINLTYKRLKKRLYIIPEQTHKPKTCLSTQFIKESSAEYIPIGTNAKSIYSV